MLDKPPRLYYNGTVIERGINYDKRKSNSRRL